MSLNKCVATAGLAFLLAVPASASSKDYAATARNIIPSGQLGSVPVPPGADTQAKMYDALTPLFDKVTNADIGRDFKSEALGRVGADGPGTPESVPRAGVTLVRDRYGVPHITAKTYDAGIFTAGWVVAEDRGLLIEQARYNARVAVIDAPGLSAIGLVTQLKNFVPSAQTEAVVARQSDVLRKAGPDGRAVLKDIDTYISGINAYLASKNSTSAKWTRNDIFAVNALKGQFLGQGGGDEARRTQFLSGLRNQFGAGKGMSIFNDLRQHGDAEMPTSIDGTFPYAALPKIRDGNVLIDAGSYKATPAVKVTGAAARTEPIQASNVLLVTAKRSVTGRPLMVGGPQIGYFYPGLTLEMDMQAPGLVWRGATSLNYPGYLLIGRGEDFATTLTSASADNIDEYVETLCDGSDTKYLYKGKCRQMSVFNAGVLKGSPDQPVAFNSTIHGPVVGYATRGGVKVAISSKRASYGKDSVDLLFNRDLSTGRVHSPKTFFRAVAKSPQTFNSFYIDSKHIAEMTSGLLPLRPKTIDNGLLTDGRGKFEWTGVLSAAGHPHGVDPSNGQIVNWNNNIALGFGAADDQWMRAGASGRVDLLNKNLRRLGRGGKQSLASMTSAMNAAGTQDIRAIDTVPLLARLLAGSTAPTPRAQQMLNLMIAWREAGGSRLDRDLDGSIDAPGAAIMDAAWNGIADATLSPVLGARTTELATLVSRFDLPPSGQYSGWYQYFNKDVRRLLGDRVNDKFTNRFCGAGVKVTCQAAVWAAIEAAGKSLEASQGTADPNAWRSDAKRERITFTPGLLQTTLRYTNRPTGIQQVISFKGHR
jgi:acyl-homoserine lactone acylase PvdQ